MRSGHECILSINYNFYLIKNFLAKQLDLFAMLAVISGGSQGLGFALAEEYIAKGWDVTIVARTESKLITAARVLGRNTRYIVADVSIPSECTRVFEQLGACPDLVLCCAGSAQPGLFMDLTTVQLASNLRTVYDTTLFFSHAAVKVMADAPDKHLVRRHLVFCSSMLAIFPLIGYSAYAPAKAAIRSLADIVRQECIGHNVRVSHVMPGSMDTEGYAVEELTKPTVTKQIEGASFPLLPSVVARQVVRDLEAGQETIYTDSVSWILGSMMLGASPRAGSGFLQTVVGFFLVLFGPIIRFVINRDIAKSFAQRSVERE